MARGRGAKIGALHVSLGLDSAQFSSGLNKAESGLSRFGKTAGIAFAAVAAAAVVAGTALAAAIKRSIDYADQALETAQKIGIQVEALQQLRYAAELAGVGHNTLDMAMQRFSRRVGEAVQGGGELKGVLDQYNIAVVDAEGKTRPLVDVLADLSDVIAAAESDQERLRIAFKAFDSEGAALVNTMRDGSGALREYMAEASRLGLVISTQTAAAADEFNDNMTRTGAILTGVQHQVMAAVLPSLTELGNKLADPQFAESAKQIGLGIVEAMKWAVDAINTVVGALEALREGLDWMGSHDLFGNKMAPTETQVTRGNIRAKLDLQRALEEGERFDPAGFLAGFGASSAPSEDADEAVPAFQPVVSGLDAVSKSLSSVGGAASTANEAIDPFAARMSELSGVLTETHDPFTQMMHDLTDLETMWKNNRISAEQYHAAVSRVTLNTASETLGMVGQMTGAFGQLFKDNKAFAIAEAVINTAQGVTKALAQGGMFGFIGAAAVAASGAAQIATIMSAQPGSSGANAASVSGPSVAAPQSSQQTGPTSAMYVTLQGTSFGRDQIRDLIEQIGDVMGDGAVLRVNPT